MRVSLRQGLCGLVIAAAVGTAVGISAPAMAAAAAAGTVNSGSTNLTVRAKPSTSAAKIGSLRTGSSLTITCQATGTNVSGRVRTTNKWDMLSGGGYVSDAYVKRNTALTIPTCGATPPPVAEPPMPAPPINVKLTGRWVLPVPKVAVIGGFRTPSRPTHDGVDIPQARWTPIRSAAAGVVVTVRCNTSGPSCDVDGSSNTTGCGWYVEVKHESNVVTRYCHMVRKPEVNVGQSVTAGHVIGYVGTSGHSSGCHLHFEVHLGNPAVRANAVNPVDFMRIAGAPLK
jgi:murein DD-endopeptidase MepM/ murein hydrolase activator NlpD